LYTLWEPAAPGGAAVGLATLLVPGLSMSGLPGVVAVAARVISTAGPRAPLRRADRRGCPVGDEELEARRECPDGRPCLGNRCDSPANSRGKGRRGDRRGSGWHGGRKRARARDALLWRVDAPGHSLPPSRAARREVRPAPPVPQIRRKSSLTLLTLSAYHRPCFRAP
jgi:hypothetical protein